MSLNIQLFGGPLLQWEGSAFPLPLRRDVQRLWIFLLLHADGPLPRESIAFRLWPDTDEAAARLHLRRCLHWLRTELPPAPEEEGWILASKAGLVWNLAAPASIDLREFEQAAAGDDREALVRAVELAQEELLPGFEDEWLDVVRRRVRIQLVAVLESLIRIDLSEDRLEAAEAASRRLLDLDGSNEAAISGILQALARADRVAEALERYEGYRRELESSFGLEPPLSLRRLRDAIAKGEPLPTAAQTAAAEAPDLSWSTVGRDALEALPSPSDRLIGREAAMDELEAILSRRRLVTLVGTGGVGKTRLALALAHRLASRYRDGVVWAELAGATSTSTLIAAVAGAARLRPTGSGSLREDLLRSLSPRSAVLVLDNCEQLRSEIADLTADLLAAAPDLRILATSREALHLPDELAWPPPPLDLPALDAEPSFDEIAATESVALFRDRAARRRPDALRTRDDLLCVARICSQLDGLPLAIELAAARMLILEPEAIEAQLDRGLALLRSRSRELPERHRTMRAAIDWSLGLLDAPERRVLRRLAVFAGGFDLDAACAVVADPDDAPEWIARCLERLREKSLLQLDEAARRYRMLEVIRQRLGEDLTAAGERALCNAAHAEYFAGLARTAAPHLIGPEAARWLDRLDADHGNFRRALDWAIEAERHDLALGLVGSLRVFWALRMHLEPESAQTEAVIEAVASTEADPFDLGSAFHTAGTLAYLRGDFRSAERRRQEATRLFEAAGALEQAAECLLMRATALTMLNEIPAAEVALNRSLEIAEGLEDRRVVAGARSAQAYLALRSGDLGVAYQHYEESLRWIEPGELTALRRSALQGLAWVSNRLGRYSDAQRALDEAIEICRGLGDTFAEASMRTFYGQLLGGQNQFDAATLHLRAALRVYRLIGHEDHQSISLEWLGAVELRRGRLDLAAAYLEESLAIRSRIGPDWSRAHVLVKLAEQRLESERASEAADLVLEALAIEGQVGLADLQARALRLQAMLALQDERLAEAGAAALDSLSKEIDLGQQREIAEALEVVAACAVAQEHFRLSARCLGRSEAIRRDIAAPRSYGAEVRSRMLYEVLADNLGTEAARAELLSGRSAVSSELWKELEASALRAASRASTVRSNIGT